MLFQDGWDEALGTIDEMENITRQRNRPRARNSSYECKPRSRRYSYAIRSRINRR